MGKSKDRSLLKLEQRKLKKEKMKGSLLTVYENTWVPGKVTIKEYYRVVLANDPKEYFFRMKQVLGNIEEIRDYHKNVILPMMEKAVVDSKIMK